MPFDLSSLGFFDSDIYNTVLRDILGVRPTGDAVADSVYLLVLPLLTLYLFSEHVSQLLHADKTRLKWVFMAIVFFFIVQRGYYPIVAGYSLFAFIILLIWGVWTFITGSGKAEQGGGGAQQTAHMGVYNMGVQPKSGFFSGVLGSVKNVGENYSSGAVIHGINDTVKPEWPVWKMSQERDKLIAKGDPASIEAAYRLTAIIESKKRGNFGG